MKSEQKKADKIFADLVKKRGKCQRCSSTKYPQCAHIISRRYKQVRWDLDNAFVLCRGCHIFFTHHPIEFEQFVVEKRGKQAYNKLKKRALDYKKIDYDKILERLNN